MTGPGLSVVGYGMWTAAGHDGPSSVAAMRAGVSGAEAANLWDFTAGENLNAFRVRAHQWWEGPTFLPDLALPVIEECRAQVGSLAPASLRRKASEIPILLAVAPKHRPDRADGLESMLMDALAEKLGRPLPPGSGVIPAGRVALPHLLERCRGAGAPLCILIGVESLLRQSIAAHYIERGRLLCGNNSSGFILGEAAAGLLVAPTGAVDGPELRILGIGAGTEPSRDGGSKDAPVRAEGLIAAMRAALQMTGGAFHDINLLMADLNGEHFKFKESVLAATRLDRLPPDGVSRRPRQHIEHWNVVETIGEVGAALLPAAMGWAFEACRSGFLPPRRILFHAGEDDGARVALIAEGVG